MTNDFDAYSKTYYRKAPRGKNGSVHYSKNYSEERFTEAKHQATLPKIAKKKIIDYANEYLVKIGIQVDKSPIEIGLKDIKYSKIANDYGLVDKRDIIWMKFTADGYLGVVATSNDINFDIPESSADYDKKHKNKWEYNTSGILVHHVDKRWDDTFVLIFPLANIPSGYKRGDIERAVGNYLIDKDVPIIDFYSHIY
jgi:hypothetical protein